MQSVALRAPRHECTLPDITAGLLRIPLLPLHALIAWPALLFLAALTAMLFRHPDVRFYEIDRVAFVLLTIGVVARALIRKRRLVFFDRVLWPMLALTLLALLSLLNQPFDTESYSLLAAKFIVPFTMFHLAQLVFTTEKRFRQFEVFALVILAYLSFTSIAFLIGSRSLIFPRFILDQSLGFHADRARGPLLQAVANGVSLNLLALVALHAYLRRAFAGLKALVLLASVPVAIFATMTRAVWLSFAGTLIALILLANNRTVRRAAIALVLFAAAGLALAAGSGAFGGAFGDRLLERGPLDYRQAVYAGGWQMFLDRPLFGWGFHRMPAELPHYVSGYRESVLYPHNTFLELLVEHGILGLGLYLWLMFELWRLRCGPIPLNEKSGFLDLEFHRFWPVLLAVYWLNAFVVVMSYQFVNGLLFTMAGMLAAQRRRAEATPLC
jgi:putative inorganic carbon (HCO3(-)) transporter